MLMVRRRKPKTLRSVDSVDGACLSTVIICPFSHVSIHTNTYYVLGSNSYVRLRGRLASENPGGGKRS
jgi:hypothetical protein